MSCISIGGAQEPFKPAIAQLVEHLTVGVCSYQMAWCKHFGIKAGQLSWRSFPLASKQSRFISNRLTKLDEHLTESLSHRLGPLGQPVLINNGWVKACKAHHEATV